MIAIGMFYQDVKNREGIGEIMSLKSVPPTDIWFETYDEGQFAFDVDDVDADQSLEELQKEMQELEKKHERMMMAMLGSMDNGMTNDEIAALYGYENGKTVTRAKNRYEDELDEFGL